MTAPAKQRTRVAACGTESGYYRHVRTVGDPACRPCLQAHAAATRARWTRRKQQHQKEQS